jgi:protein-disulfide isomerase
MHSARRFLRLAAALLPLAAFACSPPAEPPAPGAAAPEAAQGDVSQPAGRFAGRDVTVGDIDEWIQEKLFENATGNRNPSRLYEIRKRALEQMAAEQALETAAAQAGKDRDTLLREEIEKRAAVSDEEVQSFYEQHKERYAGREFEQLAPSLRRQLEQQKRQKAAEEYMAGLRASTGFESTLEPPRFEIPGSGPTLGPDDAPIKLVEFSDYQCPFCKSAEKVVADVLERYPDQVQLVFRHFPLDNIHPQARGAAEAAMCAAEQGKFWEYHKVLFHESPKLGAAELGQYANQVGLDRAAFDACVAEKKHAAQVEADVEAGKKIGVAGTPAFYVNGLPVASGRSLEQFATVIDGELERLGLPVPPPPPPPAPPMMPAPRAAAPPPGAAPGVAPAPTAPAPAPAPTAPAPAPGAQGAAPPTPAAPSAPSTPTAPAPAPPAMAP